jgi:serine/threonine protein kinase
MLSLTQALEKLYEQFKCCYGDLKPSNILYSREDGETVLKNADFGISKILHALRRPPAEKRRQPLSSSCLRIKAQRKSLRRSTRRIGGRGLASMISGHWVASSWNLQYGSCTVPRLLKDMQMRKDLASRQIINPRPCTRLSTKLLELQEFTSLYPGRLRGFRLIHSTKKGRYIKNQMLQPEVENRPTAVVICSELETIIQEA